MKQKSKRTTLPIILVLLVALIVTAVFAAYLKNSVELVNTFKPADSIIPEVSEDFDGELKKDVKFSVGNTEYPVYVRAKIVITWQKADGTVYFKPVEADDYEIDLNLTDWELKNGFYYYKEAVESNGNTTNLINSCTQIKEAPADGYTLSVEIIVQTVQAIGSTDSANGAEEVPAWEDAQWQGMDAWED